MENIDKPEKQFPLVSIITPCYNHVEFLETTIQSVLAQDYPRIEYIIVDGGSTDGSLGIIRKYQDRLASWISEPDKGQADAINKGFRMAGGEIVAWLNSDDYYFPYTVSAAVRTFQNDPELTLFYGDGVWVTRNGDFRGYYHRVEPFDKDRLLSCSDYIMQPTTFFRRDRLFEVGLLDPSLHYVMDWDLWCRFAKSNCSFHYERRPLAVNRIYSDTKTSTGDWARLREIYYLIRRYNTGLWPHGFFAYLTTDVLDSHLPPLVKNSIAALIQILCWRNFLYTWQHAKESLYGIYKFSNNICSPRVRITLPLPRSCRRLLLQFQVPFSHNLREQSVTVSVNGLVMLTYKFEHDPDSQKITIPLDPMHSEAGYIEVDLGFSNSTSCRTIKGLYRRQEVACILTGCRVV